MNGPIDGSVSDFGNKDVQKLVYPIPTRGYQRLWKLSPEVVRDG